MRRDGICRLHVFQPGNVGLVERAARIAMLAGDDVGAERALAIWGVRAPKSLSMREVEVSLAMRRQRGQYGAPWAYRVAA